MIGDRLAYKEGYKYRVEDTFVIFISLPGYSIQTDYCSLAPSGELTIYKGYSWDGATRAIDTVSIRRGSLVHDCLYQLLREDLLPFSCRPKVDKILIEICNDDKMWKIYQVIVFAAVKTFGARALESQNPILFAPEKP